VKTTEDQLRAIIDTIPALAWSADPDGSAEFFNRRWLDYTGLSVEQARDWGWTVAHHPDDLNELMDYWRSVVASGKPGEIEGRLRCFDGVYRWFLFRATPSFDNDGNIIKWFGTNTDIDDRKRAECLLAGQNLVLEMTAKGDSLESILEALCRVVEQSVSGCCCSVLLVDPSGSKVQQMVAPSLPSSYSERYPGTPVDREGEPCTEAARRKTQVIVSDLASDLRWDTYGWRTAALTCGLKACWSAAILASNGFVLGAIAIYWREPRSPTEWDQELIKQITHLAAVAIERKRNEVALQESEERFRMIVDTIPGFVFTLSVAGEVELFNRQVLEYTGKTAEELKSWATSGVLHPDDLPRVIEAWRRWLETGQPEDFELRQRRADGVYRWFQSRTLPARDMGGRVTGWYILLTDIDDRKRAEDVLRENEESLRLIVDSIPGFVSTVNAAGEIEHVNRQVLEYFGKTTEELKDWRISDVFHPDDLSRTIAAWRLSIESGEPLDLENRGRRADGVYRWLHTRARPQHDTEGRIARWYTLVTDIDPRKRAEESLRQDERELRQLIDFLPQHVLVMDSEGCLLHANQMMLDYHGYTLEEMQGSSPDERLKRDIHPGDLERVRSERHCGFSSGLAFEIEMRMLGKDGRYRWFLFRYKPLLNEQGRVSRWFATATDIEDRRQAEQRIRNENIALREEIDRSSIYEAIVGSSGALRKVLSQVDKVAPTDSTVLISGETGTGKELIASALHKRSARSQRAFVSVNCAALAPSLISSELFGHEKGAFTGATQRKLGRFELANGGTIFLDEVGELPAEIQVALLRVLQEREFERVGGTQSIQVNVRVVAATNRDLEAAIANRTFREDLFYRLNVFPIQMPPLRERKEDILTLLEYFVQRFGRKLGKAFSKIDKRTVELFRSYDWPGNVRELQNVVERSVIVSPEDVFCVDEAWLSSASSKTRLGQCVPEATSDDSDRERRIIEAALAESGGRVYGINGAAAMLRIPPSTLDSRIKKLEIRKNRFKFKLC
jgi:formate hydrogenlyase transcriptional activator